MKEITLMGTDLRVSQVCFGAMTFGSQVDETGSIQMVGRCIDVGINFFDTANVYNKGASEVLLGKALAGRRQKAVVATKVGMKLPDAPADHRLSKASIVQAIEDSLRRLQMDYVDIYYLHQPDYSVSPEETLEALDQLVRQGKVRYPAVSNYASWQTTRLLWLAETKGFRPPRIAQQMHNLIARGIEQEFLPMARELGISTIAYNPLAGGLLTGKHKREQPKAGTRFDKNQMYLDRYWHPTYFDHIEELKIVARSAGRSLTSLALNWLFTQNQIECVILGASTVAQLDENLKAVSEGPLPPEVMADCDAVWAQLRGVTPKYNR